MTERVVAAGLVLPKLARTVAEEHLEELIKLIETAGGSVVETVLAKRPRPDPATFVGSGKAEEIKAMAAAKGATLVIFDDDLSPAQVRNLEEIIGLRVMDRSALILDIFAGRARSRESRTQVELARLEYSLPRLTRQWSHLSRQAGGTGGARRGAGETQLETDRRIVRTRISRLKEELLKIEKTRNTQRKSRAEAFTVALVGYTNAGKSTLFNRLTSGSAEAMDRLFATLDAKSQKAAFDTPGETVIIDTVGFIRKLPHHLVASFRSTMEEAVAADLVIHVIDASHPQFAEQRDVGEHVLADLGIDTERVVEVFNKSDRLHEHFAHRPGKGGIVLSALTGAGIDRLIELICIRARERGEVLHLEVPRHATKVIALLHELAEIFDERSTDETLIFNVWLPKKAVHLFAPYLADRLLQNARASR